MQHIECRCKNCQKTYTYCTYGNGPEYGTESGCSMEYCAECQKAIDEALASIPKKYTWKWLEIQPTLGLFDALAETKEKVEAARKESKLPIIMQCLAYAAHDNVETYVRDGVEYHVEWDDYAPHDKHVYVKMEYSIVGNRFTDKAWQVNTGETYYHQRPFKWEGKTIEVKPMSEPIGSLYFMEPIDFEWELNVPKFEERKPKHIKREYTGVYNGAAVRDILIRGEETRNCKNGCPDINPFDTYDFLDYICTFFKYDDEDFETITGVRVK